MKGLIPWLVDRYTEGGELDRWREELKMSRQARQDRLDSAALANFNKQAEAIHRMGQDASNRELKKREQEETVRHNRAMEAVGKEKADKYQPSGLGKASDPHYRFVKDRWDRASKDLNAWMSAHPGMTPPENLTNAHREAKTGFVNFGRSMGYPITDDLETQPEQGPKKGRWSRAWDVITGKDDSGPMGSLPGQSYKDYFK